MLLKNEEKTNILVSGASGIVGYGILRNLNNLEGVKLFGTTIYPVSPANCFSDEVLQPPVTTSDEYFPWLMKTIREKNIKMIIPGIEADMECWNNYREEIESEGCFCLLNNSSLIDLCLDKWLFYQKMVEANISCRIQTIDKADYSYFKTPFIVKPKKSFGSKGLRIIHNEKEFTECENQIGNELIIQELVGTSEEEYTIAVFFDKKSDIKAMIGLKRKLSKQGFTEIAEVIDIEDDLKKNLVELADIFKPVGPTDFQFRKTDNGWKLLEINPRISSSTSIRRAFGYNEEQMSVEYFLAGKEITQPEITKGKAIRYIEDYIIL